MKIFDQIIRFLFRYSKWLTIGTLTVTTIVLVLTKGLTKVYEVNTVIYTGFTSGFGLESSENDRVDYFASNNATENLMQVITSKSTLTQVALRLFAQSMIYGDPEADNAYILASSYRQLIKTVPDDVKALIVHSGDSTAVEKTVENLTRYNSENKDNYIYGLLYYLHPYFSLKALSNINVKKYGSSDMLELSYALDDPSLAYQTLKLLNVEFVYRYKELRFSETNDVVGYFTNQLEIARAKLNTAEDDLMNYNQENRVINYNEQTKYIASQNEKLELQYEQILLIHDGSKAALDQLEEKLNLGASLLKENSEFIHQLSQLSNLRTSIAQKETFLTNSAKATDSVLLQSRETEADIEQNIRSLTNNIDHYSNTKEGIKSTEILTQWLDEVIKFEKSKAELNVMEQRRKDLDKQYSIFSPVGASVTRKEREISIAEASYLSILHNLGLARLKQKSLQLTSASLRVVTEPTYPILNQPTKRKTFVILALLGSFMIISLYFLIIEFFDKTLRDSDRTLRLTGKKVVGVLPQINPKDPAEHTNTKINAASSHLTNAILNFHRPGKPLFVNILSNEPGEGKTFTAEQIIQQLKKTGLKISYLQPEIDFKATDKNYLLAETVDQLTANSETADIYIVEHPALGNASVPGSLLQTANINLLVCRADRGWKNTDNILLEQLQNLSGQNIYILLNRTDQTSLEEFVGLMPPYTKLRRLMYKLRNFEITSKEEIK